MVTAIIVLYFPDIEMTRNLIESLLNQVQKIYLVDNTPGINNSIEWGNSEKVDYISLGYNVGIAKAQNIAISKAKKEGHKYVIFFDQDSFVPDNIVTELLAAENELRSLGKRIAAIGPFYRDSVKNIFSNSFKANKFWLSSNSYIFDAGGLPLESDLLISSGSLISIETLQDVGYMLEDLFIDGVDTEWCYRALFKGYQSYIHPAIVMDHALGDKYVEIFGRKITLHSDIRHYYYIRNSVYFFKKKYFPLGWKITFAFKIPLYFFIYCYYSGKRMKSFTLLSKAVYHGMFSLLGEYKG